MIDPEIDLIAVIESEFRALNHDARVRIVRWAASWAGQHTPGNVEHDAVLAYAARAERGTQPLVEIGVALKGLTTKERVGLLASAAVLVSVEAPLRERLSSALPIERLRPNVNVPRRAPSHCGLCHRVGHTRRHCPKAKATNDFDNDALPGIDRNDATPDPGAGTDDQ